MKKCVIGRILFKTIFIYKRFRFGALIERPLRLWIVHSDAMLMYLNQNDVVLYASK